MPDSRGQGETVKPVQGAVWITAFSFSDKSLIKTRLNSVKMILSSLRSFLS